MPGKLQARRIHLYNVFVHCGRSPHKKKHQNSIFTEAWWNCYIFTSRIVFMQPPGSWIQVIWWTDQVHNSQWLFQAVSSSNPLLASRDDLDSSDQQGSMIILNTQKMTPRSLPIHSLVKGFWHKSIVLANALLSSASGSDAKASWYLHGAHRFSASCPVKQIRHCPLKHYCPIRQQCLSLQWCSNTKALNDDLGVTR